MKESETPGRVRDVGYHDQQQLPSQLKMQAAQTTLSRETDLYAWLLQQANELRSRKPEFIDWSELAEELDEIVALARKETVSHLTLVLMHLLKWKYQTAERNESSWKRTIDRERTELDLLLESQNLRNYIHDNGYGRAYHYARREAGNEMQLERATWDRLFPQTCEWDLDTVLNVDFFPAPPPDLDDLSR